MKVEEPNSYVPDSLPKVQNRQNDQVIACQVFPERKMLYLFSESTIVAKFIVDN